MQHRWNEIDRGKPMYSRKTCPSVTLSTTNPTWTEPGSNPGLRGGRPATNRLSLGTAYVSVSIWHTQSSVLEPLAIVRAPAFKICTVHINCEEMGSVTDGYRSEREGFVGKRSPQFVAKTQLFSVKKATA
jgi:hypothetical protein